jgi:hypothetical protein
MKSRSQSNKTFEKKLRLHKCQPNNGKNIFFIYDYLIKDNFVL